MDYDDGWTEDDDTGYRPQLLRARDGQGRLAGHGRRAGPTLSACGRWPCNCRRRGVLRHAASDRRASRCLAALLYTCDGPFVYLRCP